MRKGLHKIYEQLHVWELRLCQQTQQAWKTKDNISVSFRKWNVFKQQECGAWTKTRPARKKLRWNSLREGENYISRERWRQNFKVQRFFNRFRMNERHQASSLVGAVWVIHVLPASTPALLHIQTPSCPTHTDSSPTPMTVGNLQ